MDEDWEINRNQDAFQKKFTVVLTREFLYFKYDLNYGWNPQRACLSWGLHKPLFFGLLTSSYYSPRLFCNWLEAQVFLFFFRLHANNGMVSMFLLSGWFSCSFRFQFISIKHLVVKAITYLCKSWVVSLTFKSLLFTRCTNKLNILTLVRSAHTVFMRFVFV
jgi:hypothetical protein